MLQLVERLILQGLIQLFSLPHTVGGVFLLGLTVLFFALQFVYVKRTFAPGVVGLVVGFAAGLHFLNAPWAVMALERALMQMTTPSSFYSPIPILEPIFRVAVGPAELRSLFEELFFVVLVTYLGCVVQVSLKEYRRDGLIIGDLSILRAFSSKSSRPKRSESNELGSGDLASIEQIAKLNRTPGKGDTVLYVSELRGSEGTAVKNGRLVINEDMRNKHILMIAKTGSGKTSELMLPVLYNDCLDPDRTTIVIDSKPEMWSKLAGLTKKYNPKKKLYLFNPLDTARSLSWNILGKIEDDTDCKLIANTIVMATDNPSAKSDSPFFRNNALQLLNAIMVGLLNDPNDTLSMPRVHQLVQMGMKGLCDWLEKHPQAIRTTRSFVELARSGSQNADTIMSELSMRLSAWDLPDIRSTTAFSEIDLESLVSEPCLFVVEFRESEMEMLRPMANVIVVELLRFLTKRAESCPGVALPRPVGFVIDEFASSLGRLPDIHVKLNTLRSRRVSITAAIQSIAQVKANYGDDADSVLAGFSTKIFRPNLDIQDAEWASKETGQMTIRFQTASTGSNKKIIEVFASKNDSTQEQVQQRAVLTPDEVGRPKDNIATFFLPGLPAFQGHLVRYYEVPDMKKRIKESQELDLNLREKPIEFVEKVMDPPPASGSAAPGAAAAAGGLPPGISDTRGWNEQQVLDKLTESKKTLDWENTTGSARKWWEAFESENKHRMALVLRLAEELATRKATITEFFLAYVYSNTDNIQANLHYLDYTRLKKEEEKRKREAAQKTAA